MLDMIKKAAVAVKKRVDDVTGKTRNDATDRALLEYSQVLHAYADRLENVERLYDNLREGNLGLQAAFVRVRILTVAAFASCVLSVAALVVVLLK